MYMDKCRNSSRKYKLSAGDSTFGKPTVRGSVTNDNLSDDGEIEFEGWVEFVTKNGNDDTNLSQEKKKRHGRNRNHTVSLCNIAKDDIVFNKSRKRDKQSRRDSKKGNEMNTDYMYSNNNNNIYANYVFKQPNEISNGSILYTLRNNNNNNNYNNNNNVVTPLYINNQTKTNDNLINILSPNYVDPAPPIVLKNQQVLPQLYIRQPPTVIVTNEPRPPLVINPPPANIIFKNKSPQPIYVNSTRPNIIIKNDPPVVQNPINMDTTPVQLDMPTENITINKETINYPYVMNIKKDSFLDNRNVYLKGSVSSTNASVSPTNVIYVESNNNNNNMNDINQQNIPNFYMMNNNQTPHLHQTTNAYATIPPINNHQIQTQPTNTVQYIQPNYEQVITQVDQNGNLFNQQLVGSTVMQNMTPQGVNTLNYPATINTVCVPQTISNTNNTTSQQVQYIPQTQAYEPYNNVPKYHKFMKGIIIHHLLNIEYLFLNNDNIQSPNIIRHYNNISNTKNNVNKAIVQPTYNSSEILPSCSPSGCASRNKVTHVQNVRRNSYINPHSHSMHECPKKVQIIARPMHDQNLGTYSLCR
ncbi:Pv-fam-g protein [Plasmodium falciparum RAJ116]|uniref:Pv-fam-g protein n=1 Tax=Plasmodium falciparum RAJ116 TaxID=580058 RepID=A0A0L0CXN2_PLAFA|nr:Pv-fam-g protein [Plasmodium falciparum RAJ116]